MYTTASITRGLARVILFLAVLGLLRYQPWRQARAADLPVKQAGGEREKLTVGFLPVT